MTSVQKIKNNYGHEVVDCPFCSSSAYVPNGPHPDPLRNLKRHITCQAKSEAFAHFFDSALPTPHLTYLKEHTKEQATTPKITKREFDNDLTLA